MAKHTGLWSAPLFRNTAPKWCHWWTATCIFLGRQTLSEINIKKWATISWSWKKTDSKKLRSMAHSSYFFQIHTLLTYTALALTIIARVSLAFLNTVSQLIDQTSFCCKECRAQLQNCRCINRAECKSLQSVKLPWAGMMLCSKARCFTVWRDLSAWNWLKIMHMYGFS